MGKQAGRAVKKSNRRVIVFSTLVAVLTLTSALLLALAPAPMSPGATNTLLAIDGPDNMEAIFHTASPVQPGRWKYIYVHHSRTAGGSAVSLGRGPNGLADHFVIGNGDGAVDGQVQVGQRWDDQASAAPPGAGRINPACISICVVGDFDHAVPTPSQIRRLTSLVNALQSRFDIPRGQVLTISDASSVAGTGRYFPATAFKDQLLP
jgi:N-acetyl-anhydromuramyl-L-alanine amidase AmpD